MYHRIDKGKLIKIKELSKRGLTDEQIADIFEFSPKTVKIILGKKVKRNIPEVDKEKYANSNPRCKKCIYRSHLGTGDDICCYYIARTGHRRGCSVKECDKFKKGKPLRDMPMTGAV